MSDQLLQLRQTARQIVFRTGIDAVPVTIGGTCFLVAYFDRLFAITAKHVVGGATSEHLLIDTCDRAWIPARVLEQFDAFDEETGALDLVVYELDIRHFTRKHRRMSRAYNMPPSDLNWWPDRFTCGFFLFGYPLVRASVDYGQVTTEAKREQWFVNARYDGPSVLPHCHVFKVLSASGLPDLNGLSGSPVFAHRNVIGGEVSIGFAGVALRGSASSGLVHCIDGRAVRLILDEIRSRPRRALPGKWRGLKTRLRRAPLRDK